MRHDNNNSNSNSNAPENGKLLALQESATSTLASLKNLALQFRQHQGLRQQLETSLAEALKENDDIESPEIIAVASQISELISIETAIIEGLRILQSPEANIVRDQALLAPPRPIDVAKGGTNRSEEGFYFPRR